MLAEEASSSFDWTKLIGLPAAAVALLVLLGYFLGVVRPLVITKAVYFHDGETTRARVSVTNRSLTFDRNVDGVILLRVPGFWRRIFARSWRSKGQSVEVIPWGADLPTASLPTKLTKREERTFAFELRTPGGSSTPLAIHQRDRIEVKSGHRRSRSSKLEYVTK